MHRQDNTLIRGRQDAGNRSKTTCPMCFFIPLPILYLVMRIQQYTEIGHKLL